MRAFNYARPQSLQEALHILASQADAVAFAGGTDLLVQLRSGRKRASFVVDVKQIPELNNITSDPSGLTIGAAVPCCRIYESIAVSESHPALAAVARLIGGTQIQSRASIGGNICNSAPSADFAPLLIAFGATYRVAGPLGYCERSAGCFCTGPGANVLARDELLVSVHVPAMPPYSSATYLRFTPRNEMDITVAGVAVYLTMQDGRLHSLRLAMSSVAPVPLLVEETDRLVRGQPPDDMTLSALAELASSSARPITDMRATADYRRHLCAVLTRRAITQTVVQLSSQ